MIAKSAGRIAILPFLHLAACASSSPPKSRFEREFQRYLSLPNQKVMAIAGDPEGRWVYGYGYAFMSSGQAEVAAIEQCRTRRRQVGPDTECVVYAVGGRVVWQRPDAEPPE